jgi:hypothetical protein
MENEIDDRLAIVSDARAAVADRLMTPWWYHLILGLLVSAYVVALSLGSVLVKGVTLVLFVGACGLLARTYRRMTGVWVSGFDVGGRAGRWASALGILVGVLTGAAWGIAYWTELRWPVWCLAAVALAAVVILGRRFDVSLRAQLRAGA